MTRAVDVEAFPAVSLTVTVSVYVPAAPYVCPAVAVDCVGDVVPSPQSQAYVAIGVASPSVDADASAVTASGAVPELGLTVTLALGGRSATVTAALVVEAFPAVSTTVTEALNVPAAL